RWCRRRAVVRGTKESSLETIGVGLVGCGAMGRALGKALLEVEGARLLAVADVSEEMARQAGEELGAPPFPAAEALLDQPGVDAGELGTPLGITVTRIGGGYSTVWSREWRNSLELSGGILMEVNAHELDFMCQLGGDVERAYAEADHYGDDGADFPNLCFVSLRFASGAVGMLHSSSVSALSDLSGKVQGTEGSLLYTNGFGGGGEIRLARFGGEAQVIPIAGI